MKTRIHRIIYFAAAVVLGGICGIPLILLIPNLICWATFPYILLAIILLNIFVALIFINEATVRYMNIAISFGFISCFSVFCILNTHF